MKLATAIVFPNESTVPVVDPDRWVIGLENKIPRLDPMQAVLRQKGKPVRVIRLDPELDPSTEEALAQREPPEMMQILRQLLGEQPVTRKHWVSFFGMRFKEAP